jgi:hypothetical protein
MDFVKEHYWDDYIHWLAQPAWNPPTGGVKRRWRFPVVHQL